MPTKLRSLFFWLHLAGGVIAGLLIFIMAGTGLLLTYERQILDAVDTHEVTPPAGAVRVSLEALVASASEHNPGPALTSITVASDASQPVALGFGREKVVFADPYTGRVLGDGAPGWRAFFRFTTSLHRWLALEGDHRETGMAITAAACVVFTFLLISGLILWFPRRWAWIFLKRIVLFQPRLNGPARHWNWHNVIGFWMSIPLFIISITGLVMAYPWANNLVYRLAGNEPPPARAGGRQQGPAKTVPLAGLDRAWEIASKQEAAWKTIQIRLPASEDAPATFTINQSHRGRADLKSQVGIKLASTEVTLSEKFTDYNRGKQWRFWIRWIHTGEAGGFLGQTLAGLSCIAALLLVWTGYSLAWRRLKRPAAARKSVPH